MKMRLMLAGGLLLALTGCTTYDYVGGGRSGSYYHGAPSVEYRYPAGYPYNYGPYYGGYGGYYGGYGNPYYSRPIYRPPHNHRPPPRPGNGGEHRPPQSNAQPSAPPPQARPAPAPSAPRMNGSPWRNMDRATQRTVER